MRLIRVLALASPLFSASPATAAIIDLGNVTRDTASGLDWLDVTETLGLSYNEVVAGPLYSAGWIHATVPQWCSFFASLGASSGWVIHEASGGSPVGSECGAPPPPGTGNGAFVNFADDAFGQDWPLLQSYLGITTDTAQTIGVLTYGPDGDPLGRTDPFVPRGRLHDLSLAENGDDGFQLQSQLFGVATSTKDENSMGHFLIRQAPEPSTGVVSFRSRGPCRTAKSLRQ